MQREREFFFLIIIVILFFPNVIIRELLVLQNKLSSVCTKTTMQWCVSFELWMSERSWLQCGNMWSHRFTIDMYRINKVKGRPGKGACACLCAHACMCACVCGNEGAEVQRPPLHKSPPGIQGQYGSIAVATKQSCGFSAQVYFCKLSGETDSVLTHLEHKCTDTHSHTYTPNRSGGKKVVCGLFSTLNFVLFFCFFIGVLLFLVFLNQVQCLCCNPVFRQQSVVEIC